MTSPISASSTSNDVESLTQTVVAGGYCIGCGACSFARPQSLSIKMDDFGRYQANSQDSSPSASRNLPVLEVCPFSESAANENTIATELYSESCQREERIGYFRECYVGHCVDENIRMAGSSGGIVTWVLCKLLEQNLVDAVIHVGSKDDSEDALPFAYTISRDADSVRRRSKSRYAPIEMSAVLELISNSDERFAFVGLPCFVKALRLLCRKDPMLQKRVAYTVGLVCGHLKSSYFADFFAWQAGIAPGEAVSINFRTKLADQPASNYGTTVTGPVASTLQKETKPNSQFRGSSWGYGLFKYSACEFCDDVVGETADLSIGDAWLPQYVSDYKGTNVVITRHPLISSLIEKGIREGELSLSVVGPEIVALSQAGGIRHRREGLSYRLFLKDLAGQWRPPKRTLPASTHLSHRQRRIFELRTAISDLSHVAFQNAMRKKDLNSFFEEMSPLMKQYDALYAPNPLFLPFRVARRILSKVRALIRTLIRRRQG